ncbi:MAG: leucine--tRNA ligase [Candidatus Methanoperedens sp.]|nr:leucine--tRNA ligase [Candidatus Methanoperedens sp.]MCE8424544.1 leucine--tRNA ligase [Candidatus Methanoperedens sp.]MCE8427979.1 leucine--tRNA ligase [Candidatus Methanoperedens sp.]
MKERYNPHEIEEKWQRKWAEARIFQPEPDNREKYFITIPYPYLNGNLHAGHTRTFTIGDVVARYKRMLGFNVLFPMGFHATGTPIVGLVEQILKKDPETMRVYNKLHEIPLEILDSIKSSEQIVEYFSREAEAAMKSIGFSIDWRRKFTTTDPHYKKFITWQFNFLHAKNKVITGAHPVRWCPNDENPVEDHDILKGEDATIIDYTLIKFKLNGDILPCATLRPETVFGVTNLWVNPGILHVRLRVNNENWIVSKEAYEKLKFTDKKVELQGEVSGEELIGKKVSNPVTGSHVYILPASFVNPDNGSGIVMSVPAHAPYDYLALRDLKGADLTRYGITRDVSRIPLISLIKVSEYGKYPAMDAVIELKIKDQNDPKAIEATKLVYRREFHGGVLTETTGKYAGWSVAKIKDVLIHDLISQGIADVFYEFSEQPVICRCGATCVIKMVENQWFLNYSEPSWKEQVCKCLSGMQIIPPEIRVDFENKIDWLKDKACARRKGLGTRLPWDKQWMIESLGDSTIYMTYYIIANYLDKFEPDQLRDEFFDYCLMGNGDPEIVAGSTGINIDIVKSIRSDFEYWYPVDLRSSGKDLIPNHLLFFLFHHVAIFPEKYWPRAIAINGFVSLEGQKMSKSKGPLLTLKSAVKEFGADVTRLYILSTAEHIQDADWRTADVDATRKQVERFQKIACDILNSGNNNGELKLIDRWILSKLQHRIKETTDALNKIQTRRAVQNAFYLLMNDMKWYERRGGGVARKQVLDTWIKLIAPFMPHLCEEIGEEIGGNFISLSSYPRVNASLIDKNAELAEEVTSNTLKDIEEIIRLIRLKPKRVVIYTSPSWKREVLKRAIIMKKDKSLDMKNLMSALISDKTMKIHAKEIPKFAQKVIADIQGMDDELMNSLLDMDFNEISALNEAKQFLGREVECNIEIYSADSPEYDPQGKSRFALPMRPAIYIE